MLTKLKNLSFMTKLLYLASIIVFALWVIPQMQTYYTNVNKYKQRVQALENISTNYNIELNTKEFSKELFKKNSELLFEKVEIDDLDDGTHRVNISIKKEDLKSFHTFLETLALKYYVEIEEDLLFQIEAETIKIRMMLKAVSS